MSWITNAEAEIQANRPHRQHATMPRWQTNDGLPRKRRYDRKVEPIDTGSGARWRSVSGSRNQIITQPTAPKPNSATKFERQPNAVSKPPPSKGAISGASAMIAAIRDISRPTREPSNM